MDMKQTFLFLSLVHVTYNHNEQPTQLTHCTTAEILA
jgi:hypothetical protein